MRGGEGGLAEAARGGPELDGLGPVSVCGGSGARKAEIWLRVKRGGGCVEGLFGGRGGLLTARMVNSSAQCNFL